MEIEIAAVLTVSPKLELLENLLDKRIARAALDTVSPTLTLLDKVYRLGEYKRLTANLAVMNHRLRCVLGGDADVIEAVAQGSYGLRYDGKRAEGPFARAKKVLRSLGIDGEKLKEYRRLPLFDAECRRLERVKKKSEREAEAIGAARGCAEAYAYCRAGRTAQA